MPNQLEKRNYIPNFVKINNISKIFLHSNFQHIDSTEVPNGTEKFSRAPVEESEITQEMPQESEITHQNNVTNINTNQYSALD